MNVTVYVEGGGSVRATKKRCRQGFSADSEAPEADGGTPWVHLRERDRWSRPDGATEENAHLMVHGITGRDGRAALRLGMDGLLGSLKQAAREKVKEGV